MTNEEYAHKLLEIICNENINDQREIIEILEKLIEENWEEMKGEGMGDISFGI